MVFNIENMKKETIDKIKNELVVIAVSIACSCFVCMNVYIPTYSEYYPYIIPGITAIYYVFYLLIKSMPNQKFTTMDVCIAFLFTSLLVSVLANFMIQARTQAKY